MARLRSVLLPTGGGGEAGAVAGSVPPVRRGGLWHQRTEAAACFPPFVGVGAADVAWVDAVRSAVAVASASFRCARCGLVGGSGRRMAMLPARCPVPRRHLGGAEDPAPVEVRKVVAARLAA